MAADVRHARRRAPTEHRCPGGCGRMVARRLLACPEDWARLPRPFRDAVTRAWRAGQRAQHAHAVLAACRWYETHLDERLGPPRGS